MGDQEKCVGTVLGEPCADYEVSVAAALAFVRGLRARLLDRLIDLAFGWHARRRDRALRSGLAAGAVR